MHRFATLKKSWAPNNKIVSNCGTLQFLPVWSLATLTVGAGRQSYFISRLCSSHVIGKPHIVLAQEKSTENFLFWPQVWLLGILVPPPGFNPGPPQ